MPFLTPAWAWSEGMGLSREVVSTPCTETQRFFFLCVPALTRLATQSNRRSRVLPAVTTHKARHEMYEHKKTDTTRREFIVFAQSSKRMTRDGEREGWECR